MPLRSEKSEVENPRRPKEKRQKKTESLVVVPVKLMSKVKNLIGKKFGLLTVESLAGRSELRQIVWNCKCSCGEKIMVFGNNMKNGHTQSCGCLRLNFGMSKITHGHSRKGRVSKTYKTWKGMKERCQRVKNKHFKYYGGRGIKVCPRWKKFQNFISDMGIAPIGMQIERKNNNGNYEPSNCKWVTQTEQANNKSTSVRISFNGLTLTAAQWSRRLGLNEKKIYSRAAKGWKPKKILNHA